MPEARDETYRIRKCKIYFHLEDDTIQVVEPEHKNSGIPQGEEDDVSVCDVTQDFLSTFRILTTKSKTYSAL